FSLNNCSINLPATGVGTSESTLSVAISNTGSSASIVSPTSLTHRITVASATLSPILGINSSYRAIPYCVYFIHDLCHKAIHLRQSSKQSSVQKHPVQSASALK